MLPDFLQHRQTRIEFDNLLSGGYFIDGEVGAKIPSEEKQIAGFA
jgi:hypothetical protein